LLEGTGGRGGETFVGCAGKSDSVTRTGSLEKLLLLAEAAEAASAAESEELNNTSTEQLHDAPTAAAASAAVNSHAKTPSTAVLYEGGVGGTEFGSASRHDAGTVVKVEWFMASSDPGADMSPAAAKLLLQQQKQFQVGHHHPELLLLRAPGLTRTATGGTLNRSRATSCRGRSRAAALTPATAPALAAAAADRRVVATGGIREALGHREDSLFWGGSGEAATEAQRTQLRAGQGAASAPAGEGKGQGPGRVPSAAGGKGSIGENGRSRGVPLEVRGVAEIDLGARGFCKGKDDDKEGSYALGGWNQKQQLQRGCFNQQQQYKQQQHHQKKHAVGEEDQQDHALQQHQQQGSSQVSLLPLKRSWSSPERQDRSSSLHAKEAALAGRWGGRGVPGAPHGRSVWEEEGCEGKKAKLQQSSPHQVQEHQVLQEGQQQEQAAMGAVQWRAIELAVADAVKHSSREGHGRHSGLDMGQVRVRNLIEF
jgi:hypothetical protein